MRSWVLMMIVGCYRIFTRKTRLLMVIFVPQSHPKIKLSYGFLKKDVPSDVLLR
ncbi:MAG: hypothetical protein VKN72_14845 [Nostocales cyanobacterium 94392]|nr:hypothetical protein [Nostocales cyanobacterium 94392]